MRNRIPSIGAAIVLLGAVWCQGCARQVSRSGDRPAGRGYHDMAYDSESRRVILFGGQTGDITDHPEIFLSSETWAFDQVRNAWERLAPSLSPPAMSAHAMAYDSESDRVILHGGVGVADEGKLEDAILSQTWAYDFNNNNWTKMSDGPPRLGHRMAYDTESDRIVMFSGAHFRDGRFQDVDDTWVYDFNRDVWTELRPTRSPAPRHYHGMAYDAESDRVILWGGFLGAEVWDSGVWTYDVDTNIWSNSDPAGGPAPRWYHAMAYDDGSGRVVIYGGADDGADETWSFDPRVGSWMRLRPATNPGTISRMSMVSVPEAGRVVLFGGQLDSRQFTYSDATWSYHVGTDTWTDVTERRGAYFGQRRPGMLPEVFAPAIVSTRYLEHSPVAFSPDGREACWTSDFRDFGAAEGRIFCARQERGIWTTPQVAPFSLDLNCYNPVFSHDGEALYFFAQPVDGGEPPDPRIYRVERDGDGWSEPDVVPIPGMKGYLMTQFSLTSGGTIYFSTVSEDDSGSVDIFRSQFVSGRYSEAVMLGEAVNSSGWDSYPYVDPLERFLIFTSMGRRDGFGGMDLYISFRDEDGSWTRAENMGDRINTEGVEALANCSPDGRWLFFVSDRSGNVDVYWMDARIIKGLDPSDT